MFNQKNFFEILNVGGTAMYLLFALSIISVAVIINRFLYFKACAKISRTDFIEIIKGFIFRNEIDKGLKFLKGIRSPFSAIAHTALKMQGEDEKLITNAIDREVAVEVIELEKYTSIVGTISNIAVYIGLFGTVVGIMEAFNNIAAVGAGGISIVVGGVSKALITTATGLFIAVPAVVAYNYFVKRIDNFIRDMELFTSEILDIIEKK